MATKKASKKSKTSVKKITKSETVAPEKSAVKVVKTTEKSGVSFAFDKVSKEVTQPSYLAKIAAEVIGTFILTIVVMATSGSPLFVLFGIMAAVLIVGGISGAHMNPAITAGAWATKKINTTKAIGYVLAQVVGAMLAFVLVSKFVDIANEGVSEELAAFGAQAPKVFSAVALPEGKEFLVLITEVLGMSIFAFGVANVAKKSNDAAVALGVGGSLFVAILVSSVASGVLGASSIFNPAIAVALQAFTIEGTSHIWAVATYLGGAILGGVLGFALESVISNANEE